MREVPKTFLGKVGLMQGFEQWKEWLKKRAFQGGSQDKVNGP